MKETFTHARFPGYGRYTYVFLAILVPYGISISKKVSE